jgi:carbon monoxide dehydrogenase subunit G
LHVQLEHSFSVPVGIDEAWKILLDIERIGPCMPGAVIESVDGDDFTGTVKVKLGPINLSYKGKASFVEKDETARRAVIDARGRDARGNGTAAAKVTATLSEEDGSTRVQVNTDLDITGKPAQFGRGVMVDVGNKLLGQFAEALAATIKGSDAAAAPSEAAPTETDAPSPAPAAEMSEAVATDAKPATATPARPRPTRAAAVAAAIPEPGASGGNDSPADPAADNAATQVAADPPAAEPVASEVTAGNGQRRSEPAKDVEPIDLLKSAGPAVGKRLAGPLAVALVIALIAARRRRR